MVIAMKPSLSELKDVTLFRALTDDQLGDLLDSAKLIELKRDQVLFYKDEASTAFYYLIKGRVKASRSSPQGGEKIMMIMQPKQLFAEATMFLNNLKYPVTSTALEESEVLGFPNAAMMNLLHGSKELCMAMLSNMSQKMHAQIVEIDYLSLQNATFRLLYFIDSIMVPTHDGGAVADFPAVKHAIASRLSITPETLSRSLHELHDKNIVVPTGKSKQLRIPSIENLKKFLVESGG